MIYTIQEACAVARIGKTGLYQALNSGALRAVKRGKRTLIFAAELRRYLETLPPLTAKQSGRSFQTTVVDPGQPLGDEQDGEPDNRACEDRGGRAS